MLKPNVLVVHHQKVLLASSAHRLHLLLPLPSLAGGWDGLGLRSRPQEVRTRTQLGKEQGSSWAAQAWNVCQPPRLHTPNPHHPVVPSYARLQAMPSLPASLSAWPGPVLALLQAAGSLAEQGWSIGEGCCVLPLLRDGASGGDRWPLRWACPAGYWGLALARCLPDPVCLGC